VLQGERLGEEIPQIWAFDHGKRVKPSQGRLPSKRCGLLRTGSAPLTFGTQVGGYGEGRLWPGPRDFVLVNRGVICFYFGQFGLRDG
jgi:hypothetical protein